MNNTQSDWLENDFIRLRALEPEDLELVYAIENNPSMWHISATTAPYSRFALRRYLESSRCDVFADGEVRFVVERKSDTRVLGCTELMNFDFLHRRAEVGMVLFSRYRGEGYGRQVLQLLARYAFSFLHLHQMYAYVTPGNKGCLRMFASCGFTRCVNLADWLCVEEGKYQEVKLIQCLASDFKQ